MKSLLIILAIISLSLFNASPASAITPRITGPDMDIVNNNIIVNLQIHDVSELEMSIKSGIEKEVRFTVELLRAWAFWPDEFVVSKKIAKVIRYDNLRDQYEASSSDGTAKSRPIYFREYESTRDWTLTVKDVNLANIKELDPGSYYIRVVVESKSLKQLPLLGFLTYLIPEVEMTMAIESRPFTIRINE